MELNGEEIFIKVTDSRLLSQGFCLSVWCSKEKKRRMKKELLHNCMTSSFLFSVFNFYSVSHSSPNVQHQKTTTAKQHSSCFRWPSEYIFLCAALQKYVEGFRVRGAQRAVPGLKPKLTFRVALFAVGRRPLWLGCVL